MEGNIKIDDKLIIDCAIKNGFKPLNTDFIRVYRATTVFGGDLGEWWISQPNISFVRVVKDSSVKSYLRDLKIKSLGI